MATLAERLRAKRAAAAQETAVEETPKQEPDAPQAVEMLAAVEEQAAEPVATVDKPMSFAEKMRLRKGEIQTAQAAPAPKPAPAEVKIDPSRIPDDPETAQAFVDICTKVHSLSSLFDDDLSNAMSELKAALKKNPAATELMLDEDVGLMVSALRRMNHIAVVAAEKPKKAGAKSKPKAADVQLTKEELEKLFDEL